MSEGNEMPSTPPPQQFVTDPQSIENIKASIFTIEGFFAAVNAASFPLRFTASAQRGLQFLDQMHTQLLAQLSPETIAEIKQTQAVPAAVAPAAPPAAPTDAAAPAPGESPVVN